jgi:hypothetical protein
VEIAEWPARRAFVEQFLTEQLARAGFRVIPPDRVAALGDRLEREAGGVYDPLTGVRDRAKHARLREAFRRRAPEELGCAALATPTVEFGTTNFMETIAAWDHVEHSVGKAWGYSGWVGALSLHLKISAPDGRALFERWAGIETLSQWQNGRFHDLGASARLANRANLARAAVAVLGELAQPVDDGLVDCLRGEMMRTRAKDRPTPGAERVKRWASTDRKGIEARGACEVARFAFVPPRDEEEKAERPPTGSDPQPRSPSE